MQSRNEKDRYRGARQVGLLTTVPLLLAISPIIGFYMGRFLDGKFNTQPILSIIFLILGFIAGARQVAIVIKLANKDSNKKD